MKPLLITLVLVVSLIAAEPWELGINTNLTATLNSYSSSWAGKEEGNFSWQTQLNGYANIQITSLFRIENNLKVKFGQSRRQPVDSSGGANKRGDWDKWAVSSDEIDFQNLELFMINKWFAPYVGTRVQTTFHNQMDDNTKVDYFNMVDPSESVGAQFTVLKNQSNQDLSLRLGGVAYQRINRKINTEYDGGAEFVGNYSAKIKDGLINYKMYLNLYQPLAASQRDNDNNRWERMKIEWDNDLGINVTRFIIISYSAQVLYDREKSKDTQFRQVLAVGFTFSADNKPN